MAYQSHSRLNNSEKKSNSKIIPEKFLVYSKAFGLEGVFTGQKLHTSYLSRRKHQQSSSNSSRKSRQSIVDSSVISSLNCQSTTTTTTTESSLQSLDVLPLIPNREFKEYSRQANNKCADWLMKYVFQANSDE